MASMAPDAVLTIRTYGTGPLYGPELMRKSAHANRKPQVTLTSLMKLLDREPGQAVVCRCCAVL